MLTNRAPLKHMYVFPSSGGRLLMKPFVLPSPERCRML